MSLCYIFQNGKIILTADGRVPERGECAELRRGVINRGLLDKEEPDGDLWAELSPETELCAGMDACERRVSWTSVGEEQFFRIGKAFHYMDWQRTHRFCGKCGAPAHFDASELAMRCERCGELYYPVICPAVIVCVEKEGRILLGHGVNFPKGRYSVLAGFVEPGESLEECVAREVYEESNIRVKNIKYFMSQPWAFPRSLMLGFTAEWAEGEIKPQLSELTDVRWFAPDEIPDYYRGVSISAKLIEHFINKQTNYR